MTRQIGMNTLEVNSYKPYPGSLYGTTLEDYIKNTVIVKEGFEVKKFLQYFLWTLEANANHIADEVKKTLHRLLEEERLLKKTQIVSMVSWRKHVVSIFPNHISFSGKYNTIFEALDDFGANCDVMFLYLNENALNFFQHASIGHCKESENLQYFRELEHNWHNQYEKLKKNKIDLLLDEYNLHQKEYSLSGSEVYLKKAQEKLNKLKHL